jgi:hypothetical protein
MRTKIKIMALLVLIMSIITIVPALAYDADNPASYTVNYIIPSDTAFTVTLAGAETTMDFNPSTANDKYVQPDAQNNATSTAWAVIQNTGNVNQNFKTNLTAAQVSWAVVTISNATDMSGSITLSATEQTPTGWSTVIPTASVKLYAWANFTSAAGGTTSRTIRIASAAS